jgi:RNA polymerase sigma-70 factor (ECF subfamily)
MQAIIGFTNGSLFAEASHQARFFNQAVSPPVVFGGRYGLQLGNRRIRMDISLLLAAFFPPPDASDASARETVDVHNLIQQAKAGDTTAVAALYQLYSGAIHRYMVFRAPTQEDAEDLTAEVFIRMVEGLPGYQITAVPFEAWLYRIASARIADFYRRAKRNPDTELFDIIPDYEPLPEERVIEEQLLETVRSALHRLSEEHQNILILRFVERKSHEEVAAILNKSMTAVKSAQHRALSQLTALLGSDQKIRHYLRGQND